MLEILPGVHTRVCRMKSFTLTKEMFLHLVNYQHAMMRKLDPKTYGDTCHMHESLTCHRVCRQDRCRISNHRHNLTRAFKLRGTSFTTRLSIDVHTRVQSSLKTARKTLGGAWGGARQQWLAYKLWTTRVRTTRPSHVRGAR
jgi:hypothetical protein